MIPRNLSLYNLCRLLGQGFNPWMFPNPIKLYEFMEVRRHSGLQREHIILDLGCGKGHWTIALAKKCAYTRGVDAADDKVSIANSFIRNSYLKNKVEFLCGRLEELDQPQEYFDRVYSFCVLEHITNIDMVLMEIKRILKPGGELHVSVDSLGTITNETLLLKHKQNHAVHQYFTNTSLRTLFDKAGLETIEIYPILKGSIALQEFTKRISGRFRPPFDRIFGNYQYGLLGRIWVIYLLRSEDKKLQGKEEGIMLVGRARRS